MPVTDINAPSPMSVSPSVIAIAAPSTHPKGERVRAQQEAAALPSSIALESLGAVLAHLSDANALSGYGPGRRIDIEHKGRTLTLRPFAFADMDAVQAALTEIPSYFTAIAMAAPHKRIDELTAEDIAEALNAITETDPGDAITPSEVQRIPSTLFRIVSAAGRGGMQSIVYLAFKREEDDAGREFDVSDVEDLVDFSNFPIYLRWIYHKNGWVDGTSPDLQFPSVPSVDPQATV